MKLLSGIMGLTLTSVVALASANAADIYQPAGPVSYKDAPYVTTWAGFYIGLNAGVAAANNEVTDTTGYFWGPGAKWSSATTGFVGGGQAGYNFQYGNVVFGPEVDFGGLALSHTQRFDSADFTTLGDGFFVNATGRIGYAFGPALLYAKGGYTYWDGTVGLGDPVRQKSGLDGWTIGGGLEYKVAPAWSVKAEYLYTEFGSVTLAPDAADRVKNELDVNEFKFGVNYFVGNVYTPLK
jgi:outer membrane immunogenic protein